MRKMTPATRAKMMICPKQLAHPSPICSDDSPWSIPKALQNAQWMSMKKAMMKMANIPKDSMIGDDCGAGWVLVFL